MPMPRSPPPIAPPRPCRGNLGLVASLSAIPRGLYCDVIVQLVYSTLGDISGTPTLIVWDGSDWEHGRTPLCSMDKEGLPEEIPSDPEVKRKSMGRTVTIFCYDFEKQCKAPIRSGDWIYLENVHCHFLKDSVNSALTMHSNTRPRFIWRLEDPMADGLFYEKEWKEAIARVASVQPLSPASLAAVAPAPRTLAPSTTQTMLARLNQLYVEKLLIDGTRMPTDEADLVKIADAMFAAAKTMQQEPAAVAAPASSQSNTVSAATPISQLPAAATTAAAAAPTSHKSPPTAAAAAAVPAQKHRQSPRRAVKQEPAVDGAAPSTSAAAIASPTLKEAASDADDKLFVVPSVTRNRGVKRVAVQQQPAATVPTTAKAAPSTSTPAAAPQKTVSTSNGDSTGVAKKKTVSMRTKHAGSTPPPFIRTNIKKSRMVRDVLADIARKQ